MSHGNEMICQPVMLSGYAEWPQVADAVIEAREKKRTLSRRPLFGKAAEERLCLFKDLRPLRAPLEPLFSGKWSSMTIISWREACP
jgi:hypothetical protein